MKWFFKCIREYATFTGRARRSEFWFFQLFSLILSIITLIIDVILFDYPYGLPVITSLLGLFLLIPSLTVAVRRLHDTGRSGKRILWYLIAYIIYFVILFATIVGTFATLTNGEPDFSSLPILFLILLFGGLFGFLIWEIMFIIWYCTDSQPGENKYGSNPKEMPQEV